ncbi:MAG: MFS transporter [Methanoregulaceae archaeon]|nr:MFS transporter [Methanoregulaceae archaeon]
MDTPRTPLLIVALLSLAQLMIVLDFSIVNVALPSIQSQFNLAPTQLQWVVSAYALTFGGFLLLGGRASDMFSRKTVFLAGLVLFSVASLLGGLAGSAVLIFISRAVQGLGASMLSPSALSLITTTFREGGERNRALGIFSSMAALGFTTGVILGGFLTSTLSWHWVFFVNVPIGAFLFSAGIFVIPPPEKNHERRGFDLTGAVLVTTSVLMIIYAITEVSVPGEPLVNIAVLLLLSAALGASFIIVERRACIPLVPLDIFRRGTIALSDLAMFLTFGANAALVFIITLFLQEVRGFSPLVTGLIFVPAGLGGITGAVLAPRLIRRIGFRYMMVTGLFLFGASIAGITTIGTTSSIVLLMILYYIGALGLVSSIVSMNIAGTTGVDQHHQGLAAGLLTTAQQIGAAIGVSVASVVVTTIVLSLGSGPGTMVTAYRASLFVSEGLVIAAILVALYMVRRYSLKIKAGEGGGSGQPLSG